MLVHGASLNRMRVVRQIEQVPNGQAVPASLDDSRKGEMVGGKNALPLAHVKKRDSREESRDCPPSVSFKPPRTSRDATKTI